MPVLTRTERDTFLAEPGVLMRVAVVRDDGSPLVTPIWFLHQQEPGGDFIYFTPREKSEWFACLKQDARVALCIDEQPLPYRKVIVEGEAELVFDTGADDAWRDLYRRIAGRYVPPEAAEAYVQNTIEQPRALYRVDLGSARVKTWRMPLDDEAQEGIWHERYYAPGTWGSRQ
jgi:nitroimidazol reductase NimA-like FMN-containing flavoprotein (pyridoxamine 5'-phosphate oxidase superfamily)